MKTKDLSKIVVNIENKNRSWIVPMLIALRSYCFRNNHSEKGLVSRDGVEES